MEHPLFIGLGSNQGNKIENCEQAIEEILKIDSHQLVSRSSWYMTQPWGKDNQDWFINGVIQIKTCLDPYEILKRCKEIEFRLGRKPNVSWGPRPIDIDILFYNNLMIETSELKIPHPHIHQRNFVLIPMAEISPQFIHPVLKKAIAHLLKDVSDQKKVLKVTD